MCGSIYLPNELKDLGKKLEQAPKTLQESPVGLLFESMRVKAVAVVKKVLSLPKKVNARKEFETMARLGLQAPTSKLQEWVGMAKGSWAAMATELGGGETSIDGASSSRCNFQIPILLNGAGFGSAVQVHMCQL
jgi:hypothetical protein